MHTTTKKRRGKGEGKRGEKDKKENLRGRVRLDHLRRSDPTFSLISRGGKKKKEKRKKKKGRKREKRRRNSTGW